MSLATDLQDDLGELFDDPDIGRSVTINRYPPGTYDPTDGSVAPVQALTWSTRGVFLNYADALVNGTDIQRGDRRLYVKVKNVSYQAKIGDKVTAGSDIYTVINFKTIELTAVTIVYILQVRR